MLVNNIADIEKNAFTLLDAIHNNTSDRGIGVNLIKSGRVFYPVKYGDILAFVPSKFIGYKNNSLRSHSENIRNRDGRDTSYKINIIIGMQDQDEYLERYLNNYCTEIGIKLENHKH